MVYESCEGEQAVFSGACLFGAPEWRTFRGGILVSHIGEGYDFDALYVDGKRQIMARYPNLTNPDDILGLSEPSCDVLNPERIRKTWKQMPKNAYVRALHDKKWGGNSLTITRVDENGHAELSWAGDNNRGSGYDPDRMIVENVMEELDAPGEWYYNSEEGNLYFYPPEDVDVSKAVLEGAVTSDLIKLIGDSPEEPVRNIRFCGIEFAKTHRTLFNSVYERPLRGDWGLARRGAVFLENAENIVLEGCRFDEIGGNAVMLSGYQRGHCIQKNQMSQIGASGILIVGKAAAVREPSHWDGDDHKSFVTDTVPGAKSPDYPADILVGENYLHDLGIYEKQSAGICVSIAARIHIKGNTIHSCPRAGINISDGTFGGHIIEDNDVFDCVRGTSDHGPINAWGRDRFWSLGGFNTSGSNGAEKKTYAKLDAVETTVIRHNRIRHDFGEFGIDLDDGAGNYLICDNLLLGTGIKLREGFCRTVQNNIIINSVINIHVSYAENQDRVERNIILSKHPYRFILPNSGSKTEFVNNILFFPGGEIVVDGEGDSVDSSRIVTDPMFADPGQLDYTVLSKTVQDAGFENFSMDAFGAPGAAKPAALQAAEKEDGGVMATEFLDGMISDVRTERVQSATGLGDGEGVYIIVPPHLCYVGEERLLKNDVIRCLNGEKVVDERVFLEKYALISSGETVLAEVYRNQMPYGKPVCWKK